MIRAGVCHSFKRQILKGDHRPEHVYMIALYGRDADLSPDTETYSKAGEVSGAGYTPGGVKLSGYSVTGKDVACLDFDDVRINPVSIAADGALVYNKTLGGKAIVVVKFGETVTATNGPFDIEMPPAGPDSSLVRIS